MRNRQKSSCRTVSENRRHSGGKRIAAPVWKPASSIEKYRLKPNAMQVGFITNLRKILEKIFDKSVSMGLVGVGNKKFEVSVLFIILNHSNCGSFFDIYYNTQLDKCIRVIYYSIYQIDIWRAMMNRKNIRKLLLIISLLLFPITIWYMSPYLIIQGAMEGIITGSFVVFTCMLLGSIFCGRLFCAWLCPMGGMQECLFAVNAKNPKQGWKNYIKYAIWTIWIIAVILCFIFRKKEITVDFFYMTDHGISISNIYNYVIYYGIIFLVLIPAVLFGKRIFCHYFCWMAPFMVLGTKIRRVLHLPGLHIKVKQPDACVSCGKCNRECPMGIKVSELIKDGQIKNAECIQCGACIDGCPKKVLSYGMMERGKKNGNRKEK